MTTTSTIAEQVADYHRASAGQLPPEVAAAFTAEQRALAAAGEPSGVAQPGTPLPDGELLDVTGQPATLAQALSGNPAVLVFYRGGWCPYCNIALRTYQAQLVPALAERCKWRQAAALGRGGAGIGEGRGLKPGAEDLALFAEAAAGWLSIDSRGSGSRPATAGEPCGGREQQHLA